MSGSVKAYRPSMLICLSPRGGQPGDVLGPGLVALSDELVQRRVHICSGPITSSAGTDYIGGFGTTLTENIGWSGTTLRENETTLCDN
jgi:hypothetical protein